MDRIRGKQKRGVVFPIVHITCFPVTLDRPALAAYYVTPMYSATTLRMGSSVQHCVDNSLVLCTKEQIKAAAGVGTGCGFDAYMVWTSDVCTAIEARDVYIYIYIYMGQVLNPPPPNGPPPLFVGWSGGWAKTSQASED